MQLQLANRAGLEASAALHLSSQMEFCALLLDAGHRNFWCPINLMHVSALNFVVGVDNDIDLP